MAEESETRADVDDTHRVITFLSERLIVAVNQGTATLSGKRQLRERLQRQFVELGRTVVEVEHFARPR